MFSRRGLCAAATLLTVATLRGQPADRLISPIEVERLNGPPLQVSNYAEHTGTVVVFLSTRSDKAAAAAGTIQRLNALNRRNRVIFIAVFPNPAESAEEVRSVLSGQRFHLSVLSGSTAQGGKPAWRDRDTGGFRHRQRPPLAISRADWKRGRHRSVGRSSQELIGESPGRGHAWNPPMALRSRSRARRHCSRILMNRFISRRN